MNTIDEIGNRYGRLVVIAAAPAKNRCAYWLCKCDCGNTTVTKGVFLRGKRTQSCGCLSRHRGVRRFRLNALDTFDEDIL